MRATSAAISKIPTLLRSRDQGRGLGVSLASFGEAKTVGAVALVYFCRDSRLTWGRAMLQYHGRGFMLMGCVPGKSPLLAVVFLLSA